MEYQQTAEKIVQESLDVDEPLAKRSRMLNEEDVLPINMAFDKITKNPGLQHISDDVFKLLDKKSLMNCRLVNYSWKNVIFKPNFWFKKLKQDEEDFFKDFDEDDEVEGVDFLDSLKNLHQELRDDLQYEFVLVLMSIYKIPFYRNVEGYADRQDFRKRPNRLLNIVMDLKKMEKCHELMKFILEYIDPFSPVPIFDLSDKLSHDIPLIGLSIHLVASYGFVELVEKLIKKYDSPMVRTEDSLPNTLCCIKWSFKCCQISCPINKYAQYASK